MKKIILTLSVIFLIALVSAASFTFQIKNATFPIKNQTIFQTENLSYDCNGVSISREFKKGFQAHEIEFLISCKEKVTNIRLGSLTLKENKYGYKCFNEIDCKEDTCKREEKVYDKKTDNCIEK